jgi:2-polyprenyl-6-methoxyphenol hydroxylase-like FAD-dependent oxidoreductase
MDDVLIVGGGIAGLSLALALHHRGINARIFEAAAAFRPLGAGLNLLPHAVEVLAEIGLNNQIAETSVETYDSLFLNRHGQLIHREFRGLYNGHPWPQYSVHRVDLQRILVEEFTKRIGPDRLHLDARCVEVEQDANSVTVKLAAARDGRILGSWRGSILIGCDGVNSTVRNQFYPEEGDPIYAGVSMWRGVALMPRIFWGATMLLAGSLRTGKLVAYPVRRCSNQDSEQLLNWCAELRTKREAIVDWETLERRVDHVEKLFRELALPMIRFRDLLDRTDSILAFPMVDRNPLEKWTFGRVTLLGDAAHPMYPFGSNGACQAILDAKELARCLSLPIARTAALQAYETIRLPATREIVLLNRKGSPDEILEEVDRRTAGNRFQSIDNVISREEILRISTKYKSIAGIKRPSTNASAH